MLNENQFLTGVTQHAQTGAFIVWASLDGNEVHLLAGFARLADAEEAARDTENSFRQTQDAMNAAAPENADQAGADFMNAFVRQLVARSDREPTPFPPAQLQAIGQHIQKLWQEYQRIPDRPDGFSRVVVFTPKAFDGTEPPRVRLTPMLPPKGKGKRGR